MKKRINKYISEALKLLKRPELAILPGNIAFNIVLALFPFLILIILIVSSFSLDLDSVNSLLQNILPTKSYNLVSDIIQGKGFDSNVGLFVIIGLTIATNGTYSIITASNTLYNISDSDIIKQRIKSFILLIIILVLFLFLIIVPLFGERIISFLNNFAILTSFTDELIILFKIIEWPITYFIIYFNIKLIYAIAPSKSIESKTTSLGAFFTTILWVISTIIFKYYLTYFARYDIIYGNLSSIIILMIWIYLLSLIFVLGIAINVTKDDRHK